ncbi:Uncharacterized protein C4orf34 like protein, partial [Cyphomyrmex costatus]
LLFQLRQSQDYCSETECFSVWPEMNDESSDFLTTFLIIGVIAVLYAFRPRSLRNSTKNIINSSNKPGSHGDDPPSPTVN